MPQTQALIETLKKALKHHKLTYGDVAKSLQMSEANVKKMFCANRFTIDRLEAVCGLMQMELTDLFELLEESRQRITQLSEAQEKELVSDTKLLLVAVCVRNRLGFEEIINHYHITPNECTRYLAKLDRLKIIDFLPGNRIKLKVSEDFNWRPQGPIERFYEQQIQQQFLQTTFNGEGDLKQFTYGLLSDASHQVILKKLKMLSKEVHELHRQDASLPLAKRRNIGLMVAFREWQLSVFEPLLKKQK